VGSFQCACFEGYELHPPTCVVKSTTEDVEGPQLYYANRHEIRAFDLHKNESYPVLVLLDTSSMNESSIAFISRLIRVGSSLYYLYHDEKGSTAYQLKLDGGHHLQTHANPEILYHTRAMMSSMAIDWHTGNLYRTELASIVVCQLEPFYYCSTLLQNVTNPMGLLIDPRRGVLYWSQEFGAHYAIVKAALDGTNLTELENTALLVPKTLDIELNHLYVLNFFTWQLEYYDCTHKV